MYTDKELLIFAEILWRFCFYGNHLCDECPFRQETGCKINNPYDWELKE